VESGERVWRQGNSIIVLDKPIQHGSYLTIVSAILLLLREEERSRTYRSKRLDLPLGNVRITEVLLSLRLLLLQSVL
jgi:hypothetical protein